MAKRDRLSGNEAVAIALRQINPDVFPAFPITPSTEIPQYFASFVANGQVDKQEAGREILKLINQIILLKIKMIYRCMRF